MTAGNPSLRSAARLASLLVALTAGCGSSGTGDGPADLEMVLPQPDMAMSIACAQLGLAVRPFSEGTTGTLRDDLAGDFTVTDQDGEWSFKSGWSGCESYVFIPDGLAVSTADSTPMWSQDLDGLLAASPPNVHYFFVSRKVSLDAAAKSIDQVATQLDSALSDLDEGSAPGQREWWRHHIHLVKGNARGIGGWLGPLLSASLTPEGFGFAIDRFQRLRGLGSLGDVTRQNGLQDTWPFDNNLAYAANPPIYFNYEAERQAAIDAETSAQVITVFNHELVQSPRDADGGAINAGTIDKDVTFPDAAAMKRFDTLEVDLTMSCPTREQPEEADNCGAWDYIVAISFLGDDGKTWNEMARFISSYHRAGRFFVDASHFLPYLAKGGVQRMRYTWAPPWNEQPKVTVMQLRLVDKGKGMRPTRSAWLFAGGDFNASYDSGRTPVTVDIPASAKKVELHAIITGHGGVQPYNCSEFCNHQHEFTVGGKTFRKDFPEVGDVQGCMAQIGRGAIPNQSGTWWYGRGGWCPGMQVDPWVVDVTSVAPAGRAVSVSYRGLFRDKPPAQGLGNIDMSSWLVIWE